ncbi:MAG: roadblock/LC7 domain-containing protein [Thermoleophilia bacterium]
MAADQSPAGPLQKVIAPYLAIDGIEAAGLFTADGLLVAWGGDRRLDPESIAAHAASALSSLRALAGELDSVFPRTINLGLPGRDLILAPLSGELSLALIGREDAVLGLLQGDIVSA